jgi:hypothetical protein
MLQRGEKASVSIEKYQIPFPNGGWGISFWYFLHLDKASTGDYFPPPTATLTDALLTALWQKRNFTKCIRHADKSCKNHILNLYSGRQISFITIMYCQ